LLMPLAAVDVEPGYWMVVGTKVSVFAAQAADTHTRSIATASTAAFLRR